MIILKDNQGNKVKQFYLSEFHANKKLREDVYTKYNREDYSIWCDCCSSHIELGIAKREDTIYIKNKPKMGTTHSSKCRLHKNYHGTSEHERGWTKSFTDDDKEYYEVNLCNSVFDMHNMENIPSIEKEQLYTKYSYIVKSRKTESRVTLLGLLTKLNMLGWLDYQNNKKHPGEMPNDIWKFLNQIYGTAKKIRFKRKSFNSLQEYWFSNNKALDLQFVFLPLKSITPRKYPDGNIIQNEFDIHLDDYNRKKEKIIHHRFRCCRELYETLTGIKNFEMDESGTYHALVGGFLTPDKYGWIFKSISYIPIIPQGLWIESMYEKEVYLKLLTDNILFYKPFESPEYYNNYIPDIIFIKPLTPNKPYIGEIFGVKGNEEYSKKQADKIALSKESDLFDLWYWEINKGVYNMPSFY